MLSKPVISTKFYQHCPLFFLSVTVLVLPIWEAPKLIFLLLFIISTLFCLWKSRSTEQLDTLDAVLVCWLLAGFMIASFSPFEHKQWHGAFNSALIPLTLFCVKHMTFKKKAILRLFVLILISTIIAITEGFWQLAYHRQETLILRSVGHVNHSAIYLCLSFSISLGFCLSLPRQSVLKLILALLSLFIIVFSIIYSGSRGSVITMLIIGLTSSIALCWTKKSKSRFIISFVILTLLITSLYYGKLSVTTKTLKQISASQLLPERKKIWNSACLIWRHNPVFGIGIKNYSKADQIAQSQWLAQEGKLFSNQFLPYSHAHSLYLNTLAEQGLFGFSLMFLVLFIITLSLLRHIPIAKDDHLPWLLWLSSLGGLQVVTINGLVNTTLHHEHGLLFVIIIGLWLSYQKNNSLHNVLP